MDSCPLRAALLTVALLPWPCSVPAAHAALGGNVAGVAADASAMHGSVAVTTLQSCDVHVIATADGQLVREYVDRSGGVFAVTWSGPTLPDLRQLLGEYFGAFTAARSRQDGTAPQGPLRVATPDLVVENDGHMRAIAGRAYLPARVPAGVALTDVR